MLVVTLTVRQLEGFRLLGSHTALSCFLILTFDDDDDDHDDDDHEDDEDDYDGYDDSWSKKELYPGFLLAKLPGSTGL